MVRLPLRTIHLAGRRPMTCPCGMIDAVHRALALEDEILALNLRLQVLFVARHQHLIDGVIHHTEDVITALIS